MKIQLLIASGDVDYLQHLSYVLSERYADVFTVSLCSNAAHLAQLLASQPCNAALLEPAFLQGVDLSKISLPLLLWDGESEVAPALAGVTRVRKYQRISFLAGQVLEYYAQISSSFEDFASGRARVTCVWSPAGGVGKTAVALACACQAAAKGQRAAYLNFENFSSASAFFPQSGKSISSVFEKLDQNVELLLRGIRQQDGNSGIHYFCQAENFDDMNLLSAQDMETLISVCVKDMDAVVVDLPSVCDERAQRALDMADRVLLVADASPVGQAKLEVFTTQHNVFARLQQKCVLAANKGARVELRGVEKAISLPLVQSADAPSIYKALAAALDSQGWEG